MITSAFSANRFFSVRFLCAGVGLSALLISGCDEIDKIQEDANKRPVTNNFTPGLIDANDNVRGAKPASGTPEANPPANNPPANPATNPPPVAADTSTLQKAEPGVGAQGKDYGGGALMSPITTPVREYFNMRERINFDAIKHDMDIYHAINNRFPKNIDEFKKEILEPGNRELPELPPNCVYVYEGKTGELFVQQNRPKQ